MELSFADFLTPPPFDPASPEVQTWRDNQGRECAFGYTVDGDNWMQVPGIGSFRLGDAQRPTSVTDFENAPEWQVIDTYYRNVLPMVLQLKGKEVLHASAVTLRQGVLAFCATSETGKSTLAYAMQQRGHPLFADDALVFRLERGRPLLEQVPFEIRLRKPSADFFRAPARENMRVSAASEPLHRLEAPLAAICVLERFPEQSADEVNGVGTTVAVERLSPSTAFAAVLPHAYCFSLSDESRKGLMMKQYMTLVASVPVLKVRFRTGLEHLPQILGRLERSVADVCAVEAA